MALTYAAAWPGARAAGFVKTDMATSDNILLLLATVTHFAIDVESSIPRIAPDHRHSTGDGSSRRLPPQCATLCYMPRQKPSSEVGVRELRQNLSVYLDRVKKGEALTVTEHGLPVAILRPLSPASNRLERLVAEGRATAPTRAVRDLPRPIARRSRRTLSELLDELRDDRL